MPLCLVAPHPVLCLIAHSDARRVTCLPVARATRGAEVKPSAAKRLSLSALRPNHNWCITAYWHDPNTATYRAQGIHGIPLCVLLC